MTSDARPKLGHPKLGLPKLGLAGTSFAVSAVILALEVAHIRLLSYATDPRLVYAAISIAFAGLGGGSIWVSVRPSLARGRVRPRLVALCAALALAIVAHAAVFARISVWFAAGDWLEIATRALPILAVCALPYIIGGALLSIAVTAAGPAVHRVYGMGMAGSALGCFALFPFMRALGLEMLIAMLAVIAAATGLKLAAEGASSKRHAAVALALALSCVPLARWLMPFQPDPNDLLGVAKKVFVATHPKADADFAPRRDFSGWDPVSRVEVFTFPGRLRSAQPDGADQACHAGRRCGDDLGVVCGS